MSNTKVVADRRRNNAIKPWQGFTGSDSVRQTDNEYPHSTGRGIEKAARADNYYGTGTRGSGNAKAATGKTRTWRGK